MRYYATASGPEVHAAMRSGLIGQICTPASRNVVLDGVDWVADNAVFAGKYPGDAGWLRWLARWSPAAGRCRFAVAADVVGDAAATLARSTPMFGRIREIGFPVALVAQDGQEALPVPWDEFDALFVGGSTEWKLGRAARQVVDAARARGKWVHMGRVNSARRLAYAEAIGCDSVDGTYLAFGPSVNLPRLRRWLDRLDAQPALFSGGQS